MPLPSSIAATRSKAERPRPLQVKNVEAVGTPVNLGKESVALVPDSQHPLVDLHLGSSFIQLAKTQD